MDCGIIVDNLKYIVSACRGGFTVHRQMYKISTRYLSSAANSFFWLGAQDSYFLFAPKVLLLIFSGGFRRARCSNLHPSEHCLDWTMPPSLRTSCWVPFAPVKTNLT